MAEVTSDPSLQIFDHALWCPSCKEVLDGPCVRHGQIVEDQIILPRAHLSLPYNLEIKIDPSHQEPGVFARSKIDMLTMYGPLVAQEVTSTTGHFKYALLNEQGGISTVYDLNSDHLCNWVKFVRFAEDTDDVNTMAYQQGDGIYFTLTKDVLPGMELKVWYSTRYSKALGRPAISSKPSTKSGRTPPTRSSSDLAGFDTIKVLIPKSAPFGVMAKLAKQKLLEFPHINSLRAAQLTKHTSPTRATHSSPTRVRAVASQSTTSTPGAPDMSQEEGDESEDLLSEGTPNNDSSLVNPADGSESSRLMSPNKRYHTTYDGKDVGEMSELEKKRKFNRDCQRRYRERQKMRSVGLLEPKPGDTRTLEERSDSMERKRQQACEATRLWRERQRVIKGQVTPNMYKSSSLEENTPEAIRKSEIRRRMSESQRKRRALELAVQLAKKTSPGGVALIDGQEMTEEMLEEAKVERKRKAARESVKRYRDKKRLQEAGVEWRTVKVAEEGQKESSETAASVENEKDGAENGDDKMSEDEDAESTQSTETSEPTKKPDDPKEVNGEEEMSATSLRRSTRNRTAV